MSVSVGNDVVRPFGIRLGKLLFGKDFGNVDLPPSGSPFGDPAASAATWYDTSLQGGGIAPQSPFLDQVLKNASLAYQRPNNPAGAYLWNQYRAQDPTNAAANKPWYDLFGQWFGTDLKDAQGNVIAPNPISSTGRRTFQDFGGNYGQDVYDAQGNLVHRGWDPLAAKDTGIYKQYQNILGQMSQNPRLDSMFGLETQKGLYTGGATGAPTDPSNLVAGLLGATGQPRRGQYGGLGTGIGPGSSQAAGQEAGPSGGFDNQYFNGSGTQSLAADQEPLQPDYYGQRGFRQMGQVQNQFQDELLSGIDRETNLSLANQLPEAQNAATAAGLGMSGANMGRMGDVYRSVVEQANRDKFRVMSDFTNQQDARMAQAIGQETGIGAAGAESNLGRIAQMFGQGQQQLYGTQQQQRAAEQQQLSQGLDWAHQRFLQGNQMNLQALTAGDQSALNRLIAGGNAQSQGLSDYMKILAERQGLRGASIQELLGLADQQRSIQQEQLNQRMAALLYPWNQAMQITTGVTPAPPVAGRTSPWAAALAQGAGGAFGNFLGSTFQNYRPGYNEGNPANPG